MPVLSTIGFKLTRAISAWVVYNLPFDSPVVRPFVLESVLHKFASSR